MKRNRNILLIVVMSLVFCFWYCVAVQASYGTNSTVKFGDVNGNGRIDETDTLLMQQHIAATNSNKVLNAHPDWILKNQAAMAADVNMDGIINSADLLAVMRHIANKVSRIITVKFDSNGGSTSLGNIPVIYSLSQTSYYPVMQEISRNGYDFDGWYTSPYGGTRVSSNSVVHEDRDHTLYAHWSSRAVTITFDAMGGTFNESDKKDVFFGSNYGQLPRPRKMGYCFEGWYTSAYGGTRVYSSTAVAYNYNHILYARWTMKQYTQPGEGRISGSFNEDSGNAAYYKLVLPEDGSINIDSTADFPQSIKIWSNDGTLAGYYTSLSEPGGRDIYSTLSLKSGTYYLCLEVLDNYGYKYGTYNLKILIKKINRSLTLNKSSAAVYKNETFKLIATAIGMDGKISWKSSAPSVAGVDSNGKVTAKKGGTAIITASLNGITASCRVTVNNPSITLNKNKADILKNKTLQLKASVKGPSSKVKWTTSNRRVATVSSTGVVTGKMRGRVIIKASANGVTASATVTVGDLRAPSLGNWRKTYDSAYDSFQFDGVTYSIKWGKVSGASGYQVLYSTNENGTWYKKYSNVKTTTFSDSFSHIDIKIKAKVRAYVTINGVKYYGAWSTEKTKTITYSDNSIVSFKSLAGKGYVYKNTENMYGIGFNTNGNKAYFGVWNATGTSSSYEDFLFPIKEGTYSYRVKGLRSGKYYILEANPYKDYVRVRLSCEDSNYDYFDISQNFSYERDAYFVRYAE